MVAFNAVTLAGNLVRDPELRYTPQGAAVCEAAIAVNEKWTGANGEKNEKVHYFDIILWKKSAEIFSQYMKKGRPVLVGGRLQQDRWEKDGEKKSRIRVVVSTFQFLGAKPEGSGAPPEGHDGPPDEASPDPNVPF